MNTLEGQEIEENIYMMIISSNSFQSINLREDMTKNDWRSISLYENTPPGIIKNHIPHVTVQISYIF